MYTFRPVSARICTVGIPALFARYRTVCVSVIAASRLVHTHACVELKHFFFDSCPRSSAVLVRFEVFLKVSYFVKKQGTNDLVTMAAPSKNSADSVSQHSPRRSSYHFGRFGEIKNVIVKLEYAIVEYENRADAIEA